MVVWHSRGMINADATIRILNRSDYRNSACVCALKCVCAYTGFILHYRTWWVRGPHSLWSTQSLFDVCCALIIYLSGVESRLTRLFLHSSTQSHTCREDCVFKVKLCMRVSERKGSVCFLTPTLYMASHYLASLFILKSGRYHFETPLSLKYSMSLSAGNLVSKWKQCWVVTTCKNSILVYFQSYPLLEITDTISHVDWTYLMADSNDSHP